MRVVLDYHRKHSTHREQPTAEVPESQTGDGPEEIFERRQGLTLATKIIQGLQLEQRAVFVLHELEGVPVTEVAEAFEIPLNTAYSRLRLARRNFDQAARQLAQEVT